MTPVGLCFVRVSRAIAAIAPPTTQKMDLSHFKVFAKEGVYHFLANFHDNRCNDLIALFWVIWGLTSPGQGHNPSGTKLASQKRSDHGGRKRARNHSTAEIAVLFASQAAKKSQSLAILGGYPQIAGSSQRPLQQVAAADLTAAETTGH